MDGDGRRPTSRSCPASKLHCVGLGAILGNFTTFVFVNLGLGGTILELNKLLSQQNSTTMECLSPAIHGLQPGPSADYC